MAKPQELRRTDANRLRNLRGPDLLAAAAESTWTVTASAKYLLALSGSFLAGLSLYFVHRWTTSANADGGALVLLPILTLACFAAVCFIRLLNPPWIRLDSTGLTRGGARGLRLACRPQVHPWRQCGPFEVRTINRWTDDPQSVVQCRFGTETLSIGAYLEDYGDPKDLVVILNAYRTAHGIAPA